MSSKTDWKFTAPKKKLTQSVKFLWVGFEKTEIGWLRANTVGALYKIDGRPWSYQPCPEACWIKINHSGLCINHQEGAWAGGVCSRKRWGKIFEIYGRRYCTMWERWSKNNKSPSPVQIICLLPLMEIINVGHWGLTHAVQHIPVHFSPNLSQYTYMLAWLFSFCVSFALSNPFPFRPSERLWQSKWYWCWTKMIN